MLTINLLSSETSFIVSIISSDVKIFADSCINPVVNYLFKANYKDNKARSTRDVFKTQSNISDGAKMELFAK